MCEQMCTVYLAFDSGDSHTHPFRFFNRFLFRAYSGYIRELPQSLQKPLFCS